MMPISNTARVGRSCCSTDLIFGIFGIKRSKGDRLLEGGPYRSSLTW